MVSMRANQFMYIIYRMEIMLLVVHCLFSCADPESFVREGGGVQL